MPKLKVKGAVEGDDGILRFPRTAKERQAVKDRHWVTLRHATPTFSLRSILEKGLLLSYSQGKVPAVWLHSSGETGWAACHVAKRHHCDVFEVAILEVSVPRSALVKHGRGKWFIRQDVAATAIKAVAEFGVLSDMWGSAK